MSATRRRRIWWAAAVLAAMVAALLGPTAPATAAGSGTITGTVLGQSGPLPDVLVQVWRLVDPTKENSSRICYRNGTYDGPFWYPIQQSASTDSNGTFAVENVPAGTYAVTASPERIGPDNFYVGQWWGGTTFVTRRYTTTPLVYIGICRTTQKTVTVTTAGTTVLDAMTLTVGGVVSGTVEPADADADPNELSVYFGSTPGTYVGGATPTSAPPHSYTTDEVLPAGTYWAQAQSQTLSRTTAYTASGDRVTVTAGAVTTYDVSAGRAQPSPAPALTGSAVVGRTLGLRPTTWTPSASLTYYWQPADSARPCGIDFGVSRRSSTFVVPRTVLGCRMELYVTARAPHRWDYERVLTSAVVIAAPSRPRSVAVRTAGRRAVVTWRAPSASNGSAVSGYQWRVKRSNGWTSWRSTASRSFTSSRSSARAVPFQVRAVNRAGGGAAASGRLPRR